LQAQPLRIPPCIQALRSTRPGSPAEPLGIAHESPSNWELHPLEVKVLDETSPHVEEHRGIVVFSPTLSKGGTATLRLLYVVGFPTDERPWGL